MHVHIQRQYLLLRRKRSLWTDEVRRFKRASHVVIYLSAVGLQRKLCNILVSMYVIPTTPSSHLLLCKLLSSLLRLGHFLHSIYGGQQWLWSTYTRQLPLL